MPLALNIPLTLKGSKKSIAVSELISKVAQYLGVGMMSLVVDSLEDDTKGAIVVCISVQQGRDLIDGPTGLGALVPSLSGFTLGRFGIIKASLYIPCPDV